MVDKYINEIEPMIINWLKSGNENTTYLAYLISEYIRDLNINPNGFEKTEAGMKKTLKTVEQHESKLNEPEQACFIPHFIGSLPCDGDIDKKADEEYPMSKKFRPMMSDSDWLDEKQQEAFYEGAKWMKSCVGGNDR